MTVAIDAMGGDFAPAAIVEGAVRAKKELGLDVLLVGQEDKIRAELVKHDLKDEIPIHHASEVVAMGEAPVKAIRAKPNSSICQAVELVKKGLAQAVVSAGNSGAVMAAGVLGMGRVKGIERPALASVFPGLGGPTVLIDVGGNVDSQPRHLLQFGIMADIFAKLILGCQNPKVGLLSVGEEDAKGNEQTRRAHDLLRQSSLNFIGNIEGRDLFLGRAQVVVCDGFVGNVCLKLTEGVAAAMYQALKMEIKADFWSLFGGLLLRSAFHRFDNKYSYAEYGGAPLLGVNGSCLVCHGASGARAIMNAARVAAEWVKQDFNEKLAEALRAYREITALKEPENHGSGRM